MFEQVGVFGVGGSKAASSQRTDLIKETPQHQLRSPSVFLDAQFPIDISSVTRDHDFLDRDAIEALCRWDNKSYLTFLLKVCVVDSLHMKLQTLNFKRKLVLDYFRLDKKDFCDKHPGSINWTPDYLVAL